MQNDDTVTGGLVADLEKSIAPTEPGAPPPPPPPGPEEDVRGLIDDIRELGVFGLLVAISDAPGPTEEVHREVPKIVAERVRAQLEGADAPPPGAPLGDLVKHFLRVKGSKSRIVYRKLVENAIFEFYDLKDHALFVDDVARVLDVYRSAWGPTDHAQMFMKKLAALSSDTAKFMLGLFPEQIALIYKVSNRQAERGEIDAAFEMFAPKVIWKRVFAIVKTLLSKEKRFRLALTIWARLHGVAMTREDQTKLETYLAVKDTTEMVKRALARKAERMALVEFRRAHLDAMKAIEEAY